MVGMQDQMSKAWNNASRRTDATREARAAAQLMARDLSAILIRGTNVARNVMRANAVTNAPVPYYYHRGLGSNPANALTMPAGVPTGSSYLFGVFSKKKFSSQDSDFALIGYYIAEDTITNVNGFVVKSYNLHRYYKTSNTASSAFSNWITSLSTDRLFPSVNPASDEILARNACNLQIRVYGATNQGNGLVVSNNYGSGSANGVYQGNKIHVELTVYPDAVAQNLPNLSAWTNSTNIQKLARSYEFRVDLPESKE